MSAPQFEVRPMVSRSWEQLQANLVPLIGGYLIYSVILNGASYASAGIAALVLAGPLSYGMWRIALLVSRGESPDIGELFSGFKLFVPTLIAGLLVTIIITIGSILCVIPGIIAMILYTPTFFVMADGETGAWEAMEQSRIMVWNNFTQWLLLFLVLFGLNLLGVLACGVGIFVTGPMSIVMLAYAYDQERGVGEAVPDMPLDA